MYTDYCQSNALDTEDTRCNSRRFLSTQHRQYIVRPTAGSHADSQWRREGGPGGPAPSPTTPLPTVHFPSRFLITQFVPSINPSSSCLIRSRSHEVILLKAGENIALSVNSSVSCSVRHVTRTNRIRAFCDKVKRSPTVTQLLKCSCGCGFFGNLSNAL